MLSTYSRMQAKVTSIECLLSLFFFVGGGSNFDHLKVAKSDEKKNDKVPHRQHTKVVLSALFSSVSNLPAILAALLGSFFYHSRKKC